MSITAFYFHGEGLLIYYLYLNSSSLVNIKLSHDTKKDCGKLDFIPEWLVFLSVPMIGCTKDCRGVWSRVDAIQLLNSTNNYCASSVPATGLFARQAIHNMTLCHQRGYSLKEDIYR